jgi:signal transduction histidine kinase
MSLHSTRSIRLRLTLWYAAVLAMALAVAGAISYGVARQQIAGSTDASIATTAGNLATGLTNEASEGHGVLRLRSANELLSESRDNERAIVVFTADGREFAAHTTPLARSLDRAQLRQRVTARTFGFATLRVPDVRLFLSPVRVGPESFVVAIAQSLQAQEAALASLRKAMLTTAPIALLVASLGGYILARKSLTPLDQAFASQRRFMADASHELRSPVAILQGELDVTLSRDDRNAADYRESLEVMQRSVRRLTRIVRDLFLLARSDAGDVPIKRESFYLGEVVAQTVRAYRTVAAERHVALVAECEDEIMLRGDEDLLQRMIGNLLENAIRYAPCGTEVSIRCSETGGQARVEVRDHGPGVPQQLREQIFERFFRVDAARGATSVPAGSGAGLGLPIARWIAHAHGGALRLETSEGNGTLFIATLPLRQDWEGSSNV